MLHLLAMQQAVNVTESSPIGSLDPSWHLRAWVSLILSVIIIGGLWAKILRGNRGEQVSFVIAFDITVFLVLGLALAVTASREWATACLCAGACLLGGGFIGLLFGVPYSPRAADFMEARRTTRTNNGRDEATGQTPQTGENPQPTTTPAPNYGGGGDHDVRAADRLGRRGTLLEETASSLSKLLAGASLVKSGDIYRFFRTTAWKVGCYLTDGNVHSGSKGGLYVSSNIAVMGGALILYFLLLGFLSGLFLPAYFMKGWND